MTKDDLARQLKAGRTMGELFALKSGQECGIVSGVPSTRELVYDAEAIDNMLEELAMALCGL